MAAGALSASGKFSLLAAIGWAAAGCVVADAIWFFLGHRGKAHVYRAFPHLHSVQVRLERATLAKTVLHGTRMLTVAKFLPFGTVIPMVPARWRLVGCASCSWMLSPRWFTPPCMPPWDSPFTISSNRPWLSCTSSARFLWWQSSVLAGGCIVYSFFKPAGRNSIPRRAKLKRAHMFHIFV